MSDPVQTTFQSRLSAKQNKLSRKLIDNSIRLSGVATDCIKLTMTKSAQGDILKRKVDKLDVIPIIFPAFTDVPIKITKSLDGSNIVIPYTFDIQPFEVLIPLTHSVDQDDLVVKFYENVAGTDPYILILEVKEALGSFGARSILYHKYILTHYDGVLPTQIITWILDMARRRELLKW